MWIPVGGIPLTRERKEKEVRKQNYKPIKHTQNEKTTINCLCPGAIGAMGVAGADDNAGIDVSLQLRL